MPSLLLPGTENANVASSCAIWANGETFETEVPNTMLEPQGQYIPRPVPPKPDPKTVMKKPAMKQPATEQNVEEPEEEEIEGNMDMFGGDDDY